MLRVPVGIFVLLLLGLSGCGSCPAFRTASASGPDEISAAGGSESAADTDASESTGDNPSTSGQLATPEAQLDAMAAAVVDALNTETPDDLFSMFGPLMQEALPLERTREFTAGVASARGAITAHERTELRGRTGVYRVIAERGEWEMRLVLNAEGRIVGLNFGDPPDSPPPVTRTQPLRLPFDGTWTVAWGGDNEADNVHINHNNQRRAADLYITDEDGSTHQGEGETNEDYYAYGEPVRAAGAGTVVTVIDGVPDNAPGSMNGYFALGNAVIVQHGEEEFALYAHLQPGSIRVRTGRRVRPGMLLARCGNSGNSSESHLHFHIQNTATVQDGWGIEPVFSGVEVRRGEETLTPAEYTFLRGDRVSAAD